MPGATGKFAPHCEQNPTESLASGRPPSLDTVRSSQNLGNRRQRALTNTRKPLFYGLFARHGHHPPGANPATLVALRDALKALVRFTQRALTAYLGPRFAWTFIDQP
jgi:hypothetical protein